MEIMLEMNFQWVLMRTRLHCELARWAVGFSGVALFGSGREGECDLQWREAIVSDWSVMGDV